MKWAVFLLAALVAAFFAGCVTHRYGDAALQEKADVLSITKDRLSLKPVPLDRAASHTLEVRDLPFAIYPTHVRIALTPAEAELKNNFPWQETKLRIELRTLEGQTFFSNEVTFANAERGRSPGTFHQLDLQLRPPDSRPWRAPESLPHFTSYDAVVTVLEPSKRKNERAVLYGDTYVK